MTKTSLKSKNMLKEGFTLVELIIVIVVIAILASITIVAYNGVIHSARISALQSEAGQVAHRMASYNAIDGVYPPDTSISTSNGHTVYYFVTQDHMKYCASVTDGTFTYHVSSQNNSPRVDSCWNVSTLAGSGSAAFSDGTGTGASFNHPFGIVSSSTGVVYTADYSNHSIRKVSPAGVVTTLAGNGAAGYVDSTGVAARFSNPTGIALDAAGTVYVADNTNNLIRKVTSAGVVSTLAGGTAGGFAEGIGTAARFSVPTGVTVDDSGTVYVADRANHRVRKITPGGVVSTLAGSSTAGSVDSNGSSAQFITPAGVDVDSAGNVYVADGNGNMSPITATTQVRIRKITPSGQVTTIATISSTGLYHLALDGADNIYAADIASNRIWLISQSGVVGIFMGTGTAGALNGDSTVAQFNSPISISFDGNGNGYVADYGGNRIRMLTIQY